MMFWLLLIFTFAFFVGLFMAFLEMVDILLVHLFAPKETRQ